jgi:hypothetical protein
VEANLRPGGILFFYIGLGLQLVGFASVGLCLFAGLNKGDYGQIELIQLVGGSLTFYLGAFLKGRGASAL